MSAVDRTEWPWNISHGRRPLSPNIRDANAAGGTRIMSDAERKPIERHPNEAVQSHMETSSLHVYNPADPKPSKRHIVPQEKPPVVHRKKWFGEDNSSLPFHPNEPVPSREKPKITTTPPYESDPNLLMHQSHVPSSPPLYVDPKPPTPPRRVLAPPSYNMDGMSGCVNVETEIGDILQRRTKGRGEQTYVPDTFTTYRGRYGKVMPEFEPGVRKQYKHPPRLPQPQWLKTDTMLPECVNLRNNDNLPAGLRPIPKDKEVFEHRVGRFDRPGYLPPWDVSE
eukprot:GHVR01192349.1.p1 GENE.GHVR01192349.1~~GHVR01192349.1.p1  ORF type:complete len:281 (-),score=69.04 GHVR01192349.1:95-937(-)